MTKTSRIFLTISLVSLGLSMTGPGSDILYGGLKPIGAIAFIVFFISHMLAKEVALYDQEESEKVSKPEPEAKPRPAQKHFRVPQHA